MTHDWIDTLTHHPQVTALIDRLSPGLRLSADGAWGSSPHLVAGALAKRTGRPVVLLVAHLDDVDESVDDLALMDAVEAVAFPALEVLPGESNVSLELLADRLELVSRLRGADAPSVVATTVQALMQPVPLPEAFDRIVLDVRPGDELPTGELVDWLDRAGYKRCDAVGQAGEYAMRGGIVDIFPPGNQPPVRLDFFGDQVESIAEVDLDSMGSDRKLPHVRLLGASVEAIQQDAGTTSFWSLLSDETIVVTHETLEVAEQARGYFERITDPRGIFTPQAVLKHLGRLANVEINQYGGVREQPDAVLPVERLPHFDESVPKAIGELAAMTGDSADGPASRVVVVCQKPGEAERLQELIMEHAPEAHGLIDIEIGYLFRGFVWGRSDDADAGPLTQPSPGGRGPLRRPLVVVPNHELFHRYTTRRRVRAVPTGYGKGSKETFFDLDVGDYVVHADHGIAIFRGLRTMRKGEASEEYLTLEFAQKAKLHVPAAQIELVQKYIGGFSGRPPLSLLGGKRWSKQKQQVAEAVRDLAKELLQVQAARQSLPGIRYPDDDAWMKQFEDEFPYDETDDQLAAIGEIKKDMTSDRPTDRLICGDVGFGKTEVAMRAAFKAVEAGKQVAVLCPTTVLCEQHERTFRQRMADFPVHVESVSRFKTGAEAKRIVESVKSGKVDILIGTHRLLSDDVHFDDLGLVIVDEEQRFGVEHKNKLMRFRVTVDVLTLSATPIPRTLHMALLGLRDISSLSTPPADRRAIVTEVVPHDKQRIRRAILRELNREGQCFFVHNRVQSIHNVANELRTLVPEARFIVGHGQMKAHELEEVMLRFIRREVDVLVCTTIIESGIDIPTANTMFVADADRFGLAELHQLRGRVGRYKHRAYCYLLLPDSRALTEVATRRLSAIEQYSMLGAGFKIAMRDMEIRGVGNIIGPEQSGHIATVGYQMYCQLLEEATSQLKREPLKQTHLTHLDVGLAGALPKSFIPSDAHRMAAYRRINRAASLAELKDVVQDMVEAYGKLPAAAQRLVDLAEIRVALTELGVSKLKRHDKDLIFETPHVGGLFERLDGAPGSVRMIDPPGEGQPASIYFRPPENYLEQNTLLPVLRKLLIQTVAVV